MFDYKRTHFVKLKLPQKKQALQRPGMILKVVTEKVDCHLVHRKQPRKTKPLCFAVWIENGLQKKYEPKLAKKVNASTIVQPHSNKKLSNYETEKK